MKILVTGGAGFIGSNFVRYLLKEHPDYKVINLDKLTYSGNLENLKDLAENPNYTFVQGDILDGGLITSLLNGDHPATSHQPPTAVINFAAESHVDRSIEDPASFVRTNVLGTQVLLDCAKKAWSAGHQPPATSHRFIQVSTDEVYGSLGPTGYFTEETPLAPNSPYSASKTGADLLVRAYHETFGFPAMITRCSNNYGPYQFPEKLIPLMVTNALEGKPLPVYGDGKNVRDWLHVDDHCRAIDAVLHKGKIGEVYNIGGNNEWKNIDIVNLICDILDKEYTSQLTVHISRSLITFVKDRPGHDRRYAIDSSKIKRELGWTPNYRFEEGLRETVDWYVNNREWWQRIKSGEYREYYERTYLKR
jgi:dTDP-glucose 4,6-dehydratase